MISHYVGRGFLSTRSNIGTLHTVNPIAPTQGNNQVTKLINPHWNRELITFLFIPSQQQGEQAEQRQPSHLESFLGITKTLIVRALIIYLITSFFRRPQPDNQSSTAPALAKTTAFNIFENGAFLVRYW